jgi:hypothetical protein
MKSLLRLRKFKNEALDRMSELNNRAREGQRDMTEDEDFEYELKKTLAEELNGAIGLAEEPDEDLQLVPEGIPIEDLPESLQADFMRRDKHAPFLFL